MSGALHGILLSGGPDFDLPTNSDDISSGVDAVASLQLASDGTFTCQGNTSGVTDSGNWIEPPGLAPGSYTARLHVNSGSSPTGASLDADLALSSSRTWLIAQSGVGTKTSNCTITIKDGGGNTVKTGTFDFYAEQTI